MPAVSTRITMSVGMMVKKEEENSNGSDNDAGHDVDGDDLGDEEQMIMSTRMLLS